MTLYEGAFFSQCLRTGPILLMGKPRPTLGMVAAWGMAGSG